MGCAFEGDDRQGSAEDVQRVSVRGFAGPLTWTIDEQPAWVFADSSDGPIHEVQDVQTLTSGHVAIYDGSRFQVIIVDGGGAVVTRAGREGEGPGEFLGSGALVATDNGGFAVLDQHTLRLSEWTGAGGFQQQSQLPDLSPSVLPTAYWLGGEFLISYPAARLQGPRDVVLRDTGVVVRWNQGGVDTLTTLWGPEYVSTAEVAGSPPYQAHGYMDANGDVLWIGDTRQARLDIWWGGRHRSTVAWPPEGQRVTDRMYAQHMDSVVAGLPASVAARARDDLARYPRVEFVPEWNSLFVTRDGTAWVGEYTGPRMPPFATSIPPARRWLVFDHNGGWVARTQTSEGFQPFDVVDGMVVGVQKDEFGVETIVAYEIHQ